MTTNNPYDAFPKLGQPEVVRYYDAKQWAEEKFRKEPPTLRDYLGMSKEELEEQKQIILEAILFKEMGS